MPALPIGLFVNACIATILHAAPTQICHEFQLDRFPSVERCEAVRTETVEAWRASFAFLDPRIIGERCGPAEHSDADI